ncbi:MAG: hypothetical protein A3G34_02215 [Candidatus Lindowbacteria bacterium RIFCSPLOWO2_12_FULL_62_27]|nr:MAG: hypothetical protein A3G34_02215 [Candidatus Lindowbacteria bacterium RIFCSPLOWO2_12_FULL_62_27]OGH61220.1 MAG: hypothetical protein A3I06_15575 [Candidatus Lindowbacteria bacterium RIFCSPLOWO2_02_FULL_62_12]
MVSISVAEAKKRLSALLGRVAYGREEFLITRRGRPVAKLIRAEDERWPRDWKGWLASGHPFFRTMNSIVSGRRKDKTRAVRF